MELFRRERYLQKIRGFYDADDIIKVITGVRRCGKSCLMQMIVSELLERHVPKENIIWLDLDMRGYRSIKTPDQLEKLIEENTAVEGLKYLFIDEVQNVRDFETVLNGFRTEGGYSIFITGSNSYLLSGELATKLTGRYLAFELFPLSFDEYEGMKQFYHKDIDRNPLAELNQYILEGGFPRTVLLGDIQSKRAYTEGVVREIFEKDIRHRVKIRDTAAFDTVQTFIINNFGATISLSGLCDALRRNGLRIARPTVVRYIQALLDAKILYECNRFDVKSRRSLAGEKKYYLADLSFYYALNTDNRINWGPNLENIVYIWLRSLGYSVSVGRIGKLECDFIIRDHAMNYAYMQVAYTIALSKDTEDREYRTLESIRDNYAKYVVTTDYLLQKRNGIRHVNLMDLITGGTVF